MLTRLRALQADGLSLQQIADQLNAEGVPTLSGKGRWQKGTRQPNSTEGGVMTEDQDLTQWKRIMQIDMCIRNPISTPENFFPKDKKLVIPLFTLARMQLRDILGPLITLLEDLSEAERLLEENDTQFSRRVFIRSLFSSIEGSIWIIKQACLNGRLVNGLRLLDLADLAALTEQSVDIKNNGTVAVQTKFMKLTANLRFTINMANRLFRGQCDLGIGTVSWEKFLKAIAVRNRISHPKNIDHFHIPDDEIKLCREVSSWFVEILYACTQNITNAAVAQKPPPTPDDQT